MAEGRCSRAKWVLLVAVIVSIILVAVIIIAVTVSQTPSTQLDPGPIPGEYTTPDTTTLDSSAGIGGNITLGSIAVFTADRLVVKLNFTFQYYINPEDLILLIDTYGPQYQDILKANAVDTVKGTTQFSTVQYVTERDIVEQALFDAVKTRLGGSCCKPSCGGLPEGCSAGCKQPHECTAQDRALYTDVRFFLLQFVDVPEQILNRLFGTESPL